MLGSCPATASDSKLDKIDPSTTTFSAIGYVPGKVGDTVEFAELASIGVSSSDLAAVRSDVAASVADIAVPMAARNDYEILATWSDNAGATVVMRWGSDTWGYRKVVDKHNLTTAAARTTTKYPATKVLENASAMVYRTPVNRYSCTIFGCTILETRTVRAVVNPTYLSDGSPRGIITTYCEGIMGKCPDWVKQAVNAG